jgi:hypothetical protein
MSDAVLDWCCHHGLIGIDPLRFAMKMALHNAIVLFPPLPCDVERGMVNYGALLTVYGILAADEISRWKVVGSPAPERLNAGTPTVPFDIFRDSDSMKGSMEFPRVGDATYWLAYSEPIDSFVALIWRFLDAAEMLVDLQTRKVPRSEGRSVSIEYVSALANASVRYRGLTETSELSETELAPTLLSSFARMMLDDFDSGNRIFFRCETCGMITVSEDPRTKYCSLKCRRAMMMRKYRHKKHQQQDSSIS